MCSRNFRERFVSKISFKSASELSLGKPDFRMRFRRQYSTTVSGVTRDQTQLNQVCSTLAVVDLQNLLLRLIFC